MKVITEKDIIRSYEERFSLYDFFSFNIYPYVRLVEFQPDDIILQGSETLEYLFFLAEGRVKLYLTHANGKISLANFIDGPCFLGEMELFGAQEAANAVKAITLCRCFAISLRECKKYIINDIRFLKRLCLSLGKKALANTDVYSRNQTYPLRNRLASYILLTSHNGLYSEKHTEAAEYLGVTYRHLLYVIAKFVQERILEKTDSGYKIIDQDALTALAES